MGLFSAWKNWRAFKRQDWDWRRIVVYAESGQDWHHFRGLIEQLCGRLERKVCYVSSDSADPGLDFEHDNYRSFLIPEGLFLTVFFQVNQSDVFLLTMMEPG